MSLIIDTKLMPALVAPGLLPRQNLVRRLLQATQARLVVVNGEAGAGKTSLLASFTRECRRPVAWYSLQPMDREEGGFLCYLCETVQRTFPGTAARAIEALKTGAAPQQVWQTVVTTLLNDLTRYGNPVTIVLDDYHVVDDVPTIASVVDFLVRNSPPNLQIIVASRHAPRLPLAWLRSKNLLAEVSGVDLRFTSNEIERLFSEIWTLPIDREIAELLLERTEGWATGLQLVSQAVRARPTLDVRSYVLGLGGKEQFIYDYLAAEVYDLQPEPVRIFLKRTSLTTRFNLDLSRLLSRMPQVDSILQRLDECHLFLVHLDGDREWFRYHHLFGEFLRRKLDIEEGPELVCELHKQAGAWLEEHGDPAAAVAHFLEAGDLPRVISIIEEHGRLMMAQGLHHSLSDWLSRIPAALRDRPSLNLLRGQLAELTGSWPVAVGFFEKALDQFRQAGKMADAREVMEAILSCHLHHATVDAVISFCETAMASCAEDDLANRAGIASRYGTMLMCSGRDWERAYALLEEAYEVAYKSGDARAIAWACVFYGWSQFARGSFMLAEKVFNEGIELMSSLSWSPILYQILMNKCVSLIFSGDLVGARELIEDTMAVAERAGQAFVLIGLEMSRAMLCLESADYHSCAEAFARMTERMVATQIKPWYYRALMLLHIRQENFEQARAASREMMRFLDLTGHGIYAPECYIAQAWYHDQIGDSEAALQAVNEALELASRGGCRFWRMKALMLRSTLLMRQYGRVDDGRRDLAVALALSQENDYARTWIVDSLDLSVPLLVYAVGSNLEVDYARSLLGRYDQDRLVPRLRFLGAHGKQRQRGVALEMLGRMGLPDADAMLNRARREDPSSRVRKTARRSLHSRVAPPVHLRINTLGCFEVLRNGEPITFRRRSSARIFKYLIAHYDRSISQDALMDCFWPDMDGERALRNLTVQLNYIRHELRPDVSRSRAFFVKVKVGGISIHLEDDVWLDIAEFDRLIEEGRQAQESGRMDTAMARFLRAEALSKGPFLPEEGEESWLLAPRRRLAQQFRGLVLLLAEREAAAGQWAEAASWYRKQLDRDPLDEPTVQNLLRCHLMMRDFASARRDFDAFSRHLDVSLHAEPSLQTRLLIEQPQLIPKG
ncbi:MAG: BTAD domain-containing putative transcriptional regulator [Candidatus Xenobia bacterium]